MLPVPRIAPQFALLGWRFCDCQQRAPATACLNRAHPDSQKAPWGAFRSGSDKCCIACCGKVMIGCVEYFPGTRRLDHSYSHPSCVMTE